MEDLPYGGGTGIKKKVIDMRYMEKQEWARVGDFLALRNRRRGVREGSRASSREAERARASLTEMRKQRVACAAFDFIRENKRNFSQCLRVRDIPSG